MRFAWAQLYTALAEKYGWTFDYIDTLTPYRAFIAAGAISPEHGRVNLTPDQTKRYIAEIQRREKERNGLSAR